MTFESTFDFLDCQYGLPKCFWSFTDREKAIAGLLNNLEKNPNCIWGSSIYADSSLTSINKNINTGNAWLVNFKFSTSRVNKSGTRLGENVYLIVKEDTLIAMISNEEIGQYRAVPK